MLLPIPLILSTLMGLLSLTILAGGLSALWHALRKYRLRKYVYESTYPDRRYAPLHDRAVVVPLVLGLALPLFSLSGRNLIEQFFPPGDDEPKEVRTGRVQSVPGTNGVTLRVETYGSPDLPTLVLTHGWSMNSTEWYYAKRDLSSRFQLIVWDLPGLGESTAPADLDFALETLARNLRAVVGTANGKPVILVGHSIGGMTNLTYCRLFPETLGREVAGIVQIDTTYTNPVKTTKNSELALALQKPVAEPILYVMIAASPLVRVMNWMSYQNGTMLLMNAKTAFAGAETRGQVDLVSRLQAEASPAVVARGTLAMFRWDATRVPPTVKVPVLVVVGAQDTTTLPSASEYLKDHMPQATLKMVSPSAHYSLLELNKEVDAAIGDFARAHLR